MKRAAASGRAGHLRSHRVEQLVQLAAAGGDPRAPWRPLVRAKDVLHPERGQKKELGDAKTSPVRPPCHTARAEWPGEPRIICFCPGWVGNGVPVESEQGKTTGRLQPLDWMERLERIVVSKYVRYAASAGLLLVAFALHDKIGMLGVGGFSGLALFAAHDATLWVAPFVVGLCLVTVFR